MSIKYQLLKGSFWSITEKGSNHIINFVIGIVLARMLSPMDYGLLGLLEVFMIFAYVFIDGGFSTALIQCQNRTIKDFSTVFIVNLIISFICYIILFLLAPLIASFYKQPILISIIRIYCLTFVISSLASCRGTMLVIKNDFKTLNIISLISSISYGICAIIMAYKEMGVWALIYSSIISNILRVILLYVFVTFKPLLMFSKDSFNKLFSFGGKLLITTILTQIHNQLYNILIGRIYLPSTLGQYTRGRGYANLFTSLIEQSFKRVFFPVLSQIQNNNEQIIHIYKKYLKTLTFIICPICFLLIGVAKPIIIIMLTTKWSEAIIVMQLLIPVGFLSVITNINLTLLEIKGQGNILLKLEILKKLIYIPIIILTINNGLTLLCLGQILTASISVICNTFYTKKLYNYTLLEQIKDIAPWFLLSLILCFITLLFVYYIENLYLSLIVSIIFFTTSYLSVSYYFHLEPLKIIGENMPDKINKYKIVKIFNNK